MINSIYFYCFVTLLPFITLRIKGQEINIINDEARLIVTFEENKLSLSLFHKNVQKLTGEIGIGRRSTSFIQCSDIANCYESNGVRLHITRDVHNGFNIFWTNPSINSTLQDCYNLNGSHWYGGPETRVQKWPLEKLTLEDFANVLKEDRNAAISEPYWLNSLGAYIYVDERVPLFINQNTVSSKNKVCFSAEIRDAFRRRNKLILHYTIVARENSRDAHLHAVHNFLEKPIGQPNRKVIERPIWSTWAKYKKDIDDAVLLDYLKQIVDNGYSDGQFEIDDNWEECYGSLTFSKNNFSRITETIRKIKEYNFRVTLWVHPFVNVDCVKYQKIGRHYGYFAKGDNDSDLTQWWNSQNQGAHHLDFTNPEVRSWFTERLKDLQRVHGIDSFKFDAGETSWVPQIPVLNGDPDVMPNKIVQDYVRTCAAFGDLVEIRSGWKTQNLPVLVRMIDKDSTWGDNNGLYTLITTLLQMNINGYTIVLPDMVGGNGYNNELPDAELFTRWIQANVFMPTIQFSYVPWEFKNDNINVSKITKMMVDLHQTYSFYIEKQLNRSIKKGHPVNPPLWWLDPNDPKALQEDTQYLLGDDIIVAPVIVKGATSRNVYLPRGTWYDPNMDRIYIGNVTLTDYNAPIDVLPYFVRNGSEADLRYYSSTNTYKASTLFIIFLSLLNILI